MSDEQTLWAARYHPLRAYLWLKGVYLLLACDIWFGMIQHGGRYSEGGFNVAHFSLLDRLIPLPSPALYVGILIASGFLALQLALDPAPRWLRLLLAALYSFGWLLSIHDSYQHHYLLSLLLTWAAAYPDPSAREAVQGRLVRGWGLPMTHVTCAIVYFFTGISKSESAWRNGDVLRVLTHTKPPGDPKPGKFDGARDLLLQLGLDESSIWQLFALSTIALQWLVAAGYLAAIRRDERPSRLRQVLASVGLFGALSFHAVAELFHIFEIGVFSYYMMGIAAFLLAPVAWLAPLGRGMTSLEGWVGQAFTLASEPRTRALRALLAPALLVAIGFIIPLPGARWASSFAAALTLGRLLCAWRKTAHAELEPIALNTAVSTLVLWLALTQSSVPFDYYRRAAGELRNMGQLERSLATYRVAERYAPRGRSRARKIRELERELQQRHEDVRERTP